MLRPVGILLFILLLSSQSIGQNQLGLHLGNYTGNTALSYNPASFQAGSLQYDVTILSGGIFVETDYAYILNSHVVELLFDDKPLIEFPEEGANLSPDVNYYRFVNATKPMNTSVSAFVGLPSFSIRLNRKISVGLFAKQRMGFTANNLDKDLSFPSLSNWPLGQSKEFSSTKVSGMMWAEFGGNLAYGFTYEKRKVSIAANIKYLVGQQALYVFSPSERDMILNGRTASIDDNDLYLGFTNFDEEFSLDHKGSGFGADIGIVIVESGSERDLYKWRLGASITDLGYVNFKKGSEAHHYYSESDQVVQTAAFDQVQSLSDFASVFSNETMGSPSASLSGNDFRIYTPTALNLNFDYALPYKLFANASLNRRIILNPIQVDKENYYALSLRFEREYFEIGVPAVLYDDTKLRLGFWMRLGPLIIGSDHVASLFINQSKFSGSDIYFALKIIDFNSFKRSKNNRNNKPENCYW